MGLGISPDGKKLYANIRRWPDGALPHIEEPPPISTSIEMVSIGLDDLSVSERTLTGHKGFTDSREAFYIYLDVGELLVASGSEDGRARLWDRHYGCHVMSAQHDACVNCAVLNPSQQEMLVTSSDDYSIKVWKSKGMLREESRPIYRQL